MSEEPKATEETKASEEPEATEESKASEEPEVPEESKVTEEPEVPEESKVIEEPEVMEEPKVNEELKATEVPKSEEVPVEVQAFLDAVAKLPIVEDVTKENAEAIGEQVNAVLDMAEALSAENYVREDVSGALAIAYDMMEVVLEKEEIPESDTFDSTPTSNVITSGFSKFYPTTSTYNQVSGNGAEPGYGKVELTDENPTATDYLYTTYWGSYMGDAYYPISWDTLTIAAEYSMYYDSNIAKATVTTGTYSNGRPCIVVTIEKGTKKGSTVVPIYYNLGKVRTDAGIDGTVYGAVSGYIFYDVTNDGSSTTVTPGEKPDLPNKGNIVNPDDGELMDIPINVSCATQTSSHYDGGYDRNGDMWYCLISEGVAGRGYAISEITPNTQSVNSYDAKYFPWKCTLTVDSRHYAYWVNLWNDNFADQYSRHAVNPNFNSTFSITYYWNVSNGGFWMYGGSMRSFTVQSVCTPEKPTASTIGKAYVEVQCRNNESHKAGGNGEAAYLLASNPDGWSAATPTALTTATAVDKFEEQLVEAGVRWKSVLTLKNSYWANKYDSTDHELDDSNTYTITAYWYNKWMFNTNDCVRTIYVKEKTPTAPTKDEAADILNDKYTVKVKCTNEKRQHTLVEKAYSITAADITSISAPYKNDFNKWEVEVCSTNQKFVEKFEKETNVACDHDDKSNGFSVKLVWNGSEWTYADTYTREVETECHPAKTIPYTVVYKAYY